MKRSSVILGAAFLMATSAIGPGFITQTTVFTQQLLTSFGFVIAVSVLLDIIAQLNIWRIIAVAEKPAQQIASSVFPGMGQLLSVLILLGGLAFNIGNIAGCGLGINILFPVDTSMDAPVYGALISAVLALIIFWFREAGKAMDWFTRILGIIMIGLTLFVAYQSHPPVTKALYHSILPEKTDLKAIITLVGGTVGGYITFAGAHRLLDAGVKGQNQLKAVTSGSIQAILLASLMRVLLFLAALGIVMQQYKLDPLNPAASVFQAAAGVVGYKIFGIVLWAAAITSVVGSAYTSVSFIRNYHPAIEKYQRWIITAFILASTGIFISIGKPVKLLILAGALNGLILPVSLGLMLLAVWKKNQIPGYQHPRWMSIAGWLVVGIMTWLSIEVLRTELPRLFS